MWPVLCVDSGETESAVGQVWSVNVVFITEWNIESQYTCHGLTDARRSARVRFCVRTYLASVDTGINNVIMFTSSHISLGC